ncbi:hypothetical protein CVT24_000834 [Panaeolus cyanescens]|uniref:Uncharacterized protein n=1 Tax=Panaeolus cyanescens TaxID=181874 RepID=A0A409VWU4_9AGAR|nr:hypothetical protein CVT24_000834 [Panaeolus cyanescens]
MESVMDTKFAQYLKDNTLPPDDIIAELKELLEEPAKELDKAERDVLLLSLVLARVKLRRDSLAEKIRSYSPILSPIRQLPPDILGEIFYHCLSIHRNPIMHSSEAPLLLTRVCRSWRSIAYSTPKLWSRLYIPFPYRFKRPFESYTQEEGGTIEPEQIFNFRLKALEEWLARSGAHPLSLSMKCVDTQIAQDSPELSQKPDDYALNILSTSARHSQRWHDLELHMPMRLFDEFQNLVSVDQLPMLTNFRAIFDDRMEDDKADIKWLLTPSLRRLSLKADFHPWDSFAISVNWASLTYLCLHSPISPRIAAEILVQCQQLEDCSISLLRLWYRHQSEQDAITVDNIYLPRLKSLMIDGDGLYKRMYLCNRIVAPELQNVYYYSSQPSFMRRRRSSSSSPRSTSRERNSQSPLLPLRTLLNRSKSVKKLSFNPRGLSDTEVHQLLQAASSVETLLVDYYGWKGRPSHSASTWGDCFDLKLLLPPSLRTMSVDNAEEGGSFDASTTLNQISPNDPILLPHLTSIKAWGVSAMTDQTLLDFITSRMEGECTKHGCAPLKHVLVSFNRVKQMDIVPRVRKIEPDGEQLQLSLFYTPDVPFYLKETSARLGLNAFGPDTTWPFPEIAAYNIL